MRLIAECHPVLVPAIFLDKDGTLVADEPDNVDPALVRLMPNAGPGLKILAVLGFPIIIISNQPGIALGRYEPAALLKLEQRLRLLFTEQGAHLAGFHFCPHHPRGCIAEYATSCTCRKPMPGLLQRAALLHGIDLSESWFIGDMLDDVEAGRRAGCRTLLLDRAEEIQWRRTISSNAHWRTPELTAPDLEIAAYKIASRLRHPEPLHPVPTERA